MEKQRCKKKVRWSAIHQGGHTRQCKRYAVKDGYCKMHHPETEFEIGEKKDEKTTLKTYMKLFNYATSTPS